MQADATLPGGTIVPTLRYRDVAGAIDWLCKAFGFEKHQVVRGDDGAVRYAELTFGTGMVMLAPADDPTFDKLMAQPAETGGVETQICYLFVADAGAHCARSTAAGAEILLDIEDEGDGRGYSCRDPEGHVWNFGTYDPWKRVGPVAPSPRRRHSRAWTGIRRAAFAIVLLVTAIASAMVAEQGIPPTLVEWVTAAKASVNHAALAAATDRELYERDRRETAERAAKEVREQLARELTARQTTERSLKETQAQLARERSAKEQAEQTARDAREQLRGTGAEQQALAEAREQLARQRAALESAQRIAEEARERLLLAERSADAARNELATERGSRQAAERSIQQAKEQLAKEHSAKEAAERAASEAKERQTRKQPPPRRAVQYGEPASVWSFPKWDQ